MILVVGSVVGYPLVASAQASNGEAAANSLGETSLARHQGFTGGFSLGAGFMSSGGCAVCGSTGGFAIDASVGWFVNRRVALMLEVSALSTAEIDPTTGPLAVATSSAMQAVTVQYWASPAFWIEGGLGYTRLLAATPIATGDAGGGGMSIGAGYEILHRGSFGLDARGRLVHADIEGTGFNSFAFLVGLNWY